MKPIMMTTMMRNGELDFLCCSTADHHYDVDYDDVDDDDDIYIMVECISVCLSQKSLFSSGQWSPAGLLMMTIYI